MRKGEGNCVTAALPKWQRLTAQGEWEYFMDDLIKLIQVCIHRPSMRERKNLAYCCSV